ncbi:rRNA/tRNA cytidine N-acetyltransferase [Schizosaccharomyces pombe]|uniref:RNA cytidine acetyltransferase n=1 Tax=Schizosaccharomyces pombe (strain 972 / ATCC 24843) TaxID=284812 RepID=NAT10_SCHPO|nr:putative ribosome biogenesis ATPase [Schizosaccharomyces pombe]P87115.1 RecName: Full=RNA cytidine acetyltransferase; AltName: Full=18S rRNA cytosine acetyltransferase [Schizosaccharomyces pombe 972h-]CAB08603.1 ribosome biogenesis ATPase (predicted) [Schizosaccharomyces pombe]|eukprot:NP_593326.1 putative ribosome biogenesis ATPase [Schizosaccharomyces pombe]
MPKKALDSRIPTLIKNGCQEKQRSFFVVVGDRARDQVVNLHWLLSQSKVAARPNVLWMYKKDLLGFTSHRKKRENKIKKEIKRGIRDPNSEDPFELFCSITNIRYCYYKESEKILGQTYGMLVLQDFEALTPNLLARTIETVEGGGIVVLLLHKLNSLKQLYTMSMDIHSRYRTEAHSDVTARFNERFILSLGNCENCLVIDDELNVLPISGGKNVKALPPTLEEDNSTQNSIKELQESLGEDHPAGALVGVTKTLDQARAVLTFVESIVEKSLKGTVSLTAGRGRGKSAALGLAIAAAIAHGYSNIFITSPSPENLKTLFEFIFKGFDALNYEEHVDYDIIQSTNPAYHNAIVRVNIFRDHRQTIQYISPEDSNVLGQAELVVIDEAAAIPLPLVRKLIGPYLVFMASTINGYEGTGRSLSLKLLQQLREQSRIYSGSGNNKSDSQSHISGRTLKEISLDEPIRYAMGDRIELWLNKLLCLDAASYVSRMATQGFPHPSECSLYRVSRDTLFSYHPISEAFLQRMMSLYVASHYKNSPNDLQLMSDAPAHQLFVLLPPVDLKNPKLPDPICVIQLALEGSISRESIMNSLSRGQRAGGDLIPWLISQQFQDENFAALGGARIVRIAVSPEHVKMGYGTRAMQLLHEYFEGKFISASEEFKAVKHSLKRIGDEEIENTALQTEKIHVRDAKTMPPLLLKLSELQPEPLHYVGVSYGLTPSLQKFWKREGYCPLYLRQTANDLTGEHTCVMLRVLEGRDSEWLGAFAQNFYRRFLSLLGYQFREFAAITALSVLDACNNGTKYVVNSTSKLTNEEINNVFESYDLKRLESYSNNLLDYHVIVDLLPKLAHLYFSGKFPDSVKLSPVQQSVLLALGLQYKTIDTLEKEFNLPSNQLLAMLVKLSKKIMKCIDEIETKDIEEELGSNKKTESSNSKLPEFTPLQQSLEEELQEGADEAMLALREKQRELINAIDLEKYAIRGNEEDWKAAENQIQKTNGKGARVVSIKGEKRKNNSLDASDKKTKEKPSSKKKFRK